VTVHVVGELIPTGLGVHTTLVLVARVLAVSVAEPLLPTWVASPA
jgi:hypothetical protein